MKKALLLYLIAIYSSTNHCMDTPESIWSRITSFVASFNSDNNPTIWIQTNDGKTAEYDHNICSQSTLFIEKIRFNNKGFNEQTAITLPVSKKEFMLFVKAVSTPIQNFDKHFSQKIFLLFSIANLLKSPYLYALLLHKLLPNDIDKHIRKLYFSLTNIRNRMIECNPLSTSPSIMHSYFACPTFKAKFTHSGDYYLSKIKSFNLKKIVIRHTLRETATHKLTKELDTNEIVQLSPKDNFVALAQKHILRLYDIDADAMISLPEKEEISSITFSPDGNYIAVTVKNNIHLWNISNKNCITKQELVGHSKTIRALAFNKQGTLLVSGSNERENSIILWNISNDNNIIKKILLKGEHHHFESFTFSANDKNILCKRIHSTSLYFSNKDESWSYHYIPQHYNSFTLLKQNSNHSFNASYTLNNKLYLWNTDEKSMTTPLIFRHTYPIIDTHFNNNHDLFVSRSTHNFTIWNYERKKIKTIAYEENKHLFATLSNDGTQLLCASRKNNSPHIKVTIHKLFDEKIIEEMDKSLTTMEGLLLQNICTANKPFIIRNKSLQAQIWQRFEPSHQKMLQQLFIIQHSD